MKLLIVRSIPLSQETSDAWRSVGGTFVRRNREGYLPKVLTDRYEAVLNLGNTSLKVEDEECVVFNRVDTIVAISHPNNLRKTLDVYIPPRDFSGRHWHKQGGFGGSGKKFCEVGEGSCAVQGGDIQQHVEGNEFRVITVGDKIVQSHAKTGSILDDGFTWTWTGVSGIRTNGIIPLVKEACDDIVHSRRSVLGWDIIVAKDKPYVIEINTSPGVNEATARRIVDGMRYVG